MTPEATPSGRVFQFEEWRRRIDLYATGANVHSLLGKLGSMQGVERIVKTSGWDEQTEKWFDEIVAEFNKLRK